MAEAQPRNITPMVLTSPVSASLPIPRGARSIDDRVADRDSPLLSTRARSYESVSSFAGYEPIPIDVDPEGHRFSQLPTITLIEMLERYHTKLALPVAAYVSRSRTDRTQWRVVWTMPDGDHEAWEMAFDHANGTYVHDGQTEKTYFNFTEALERSLCTLERVYARPADTPIPCGPT